MSLDSGSSSLLERLPAELHREIVSYLVASNSTKSIHTLASTCKRFFDIFAPFAVQTYRSSEIPKERSQTRNRNLQFLHHMAISHPELIRHVQTLDLHDWGLKSDGTESDLAIRDDEWSVCKRLVDETFPSEDQSEIRKQWVKLLQEEWEDALMALLLAVCTNIKTLIYRIPKKYRIFLRVLNAGVSNQNGAEPGVSFPRLQNITQKPNTMSKSRWFLYDPSNNESPEFKFDEHFIKILQMPSLRSYECNGMTLAGDMDKEVLGKLPRPSVSIESLSITDSNCQFSSLNALLAMCRGLRAFTSTRAREKPITLEMAVRGIVRALIPHSDTMEYLHLDSNETWRLAYVLDPETFWSYAGVELKKLHRLKHLKVVIEALKGLFNPFEAVMD
ncbi:hypothetical protein ACKAV7_008215 [Fusarium commune]|uniref:F-box domain-containing protein n=1 Tax=Fusarium oxysporum f. sp. rapae TaxID=485398 RepID=A0A8J5P5F9_FUSOX|nr:hypothetical protein Forpe1208_v008230 [Fusarium oxysporum f. sp. rapae]